MVKDNEISSVTAFDDIDKPSQKIIQDCVHCGFCLSACPTYLETGNELDSPRGRIYLIKSAANGEISMNDSFVKHLDLCLGCLACETACPSGVKYSNLIERTRAQIERNYKRGWFDNLFKKLLFQLLPYPSRLKLLLPIFYLVNVLKIRKVIKTRFFNRLDPRLKALYEMAPDVDSPVYYNPPEFIPSKTNRRYKVAALLGCVQNVFFSNTNRATIEVLTQNGCDVYVPKEQGCCGALSIHSGRLEEGRGFAQNLIDVFSKLDIDYIVVNSAGCGSSMKEYCEILKDDPDYRDKAMEFSGKTRDIMEFLDEIGIESKLNELKVRVTYQDACHIVHGQKIRTQPRDIISLIPGVELIEMNGSDQCCGSAGIYNILQPDMSDSILEKKLDNIEKTNADYLLAGNPGCLIQKQKGLRTRGKDIKIAHPIELLYWSINNQNI